MGIGSEQAHVGAARDARVLRVDEGRDRGDWVLREDGGQRGVGRQRRRSTDPERPAIWLAAEDRNTVFHSIYFHPI